MFVTVEFDNLGEEYKVEGRQAMGRINNPIPEADGNSKTHYGVWISPEGDEKSFGLGYFLSLGDARDVLMRALERNWSATQWLAEHGIAAE